MKHVIDKIIVKGTRENNLKNIEVSIPKNELVVLLGYLVQANNH